MDKLGRYIHSIKKFFTRLRIKILRSPLALHIYSAFALVILFIFISVSIGINAILNSYVNQECSRRIDNAINSCQSFAIAFRSSLSELDVSNPEQIRSHLLDSIISSTELSNEASIALVSINDLNNPKEYSLVYPSLFYSASNTRLATNILDAITSDGPIDTDKITDTVYIGDINYYYRFVKVEYSDSSNDNTDFEDYYMVFYVDPSNYMAFVDSVNEALFTTMVLSIAVAGVLSIFVSYPVISSTKQLSRFARRISKGDFRGREFNAVSKELHDLSNTMIHMARRLEESDKEQKTFFQNASHELRTPLMSIQGYAEGIKHNVFDESEKDATIDIIIDESNRLSNMVENLLSISRMDLSSKGNYIISKSILDSNQLVGHIIEKVRGGFLYSGKELVNSIKLNNVYIYANENDLFRMLENVISNGLRYATKQVQFKCWADDKVVYFEISDDGPGISKEIFPKLFDRFAKGKDGKHGIGLALVKSIAEEHSGDITASNKPEGGAKFVIRIPRVNPDDAI